MIATGRYRKIWKIRLLAQIGCLLRNYKTDHIHTLQWKIRMVEPYLPLGVTIWSPPGSWWKPTKNERRFCQFANFTLPHPSSRRCHDVEIGTGESLWWVLLFAILTCSKILTVQEQSWMTFVKFHSFLDCLDELLGFSFFHQRPK